jgi:hypothetical protein
MTGWVFERGASLPARARIPIRIHAHSNLVVAFWEAAHVTSPEREMLAVAKLPANLPLAEVHLFATLSENLELGAWLEVGTDKIPLVLSKPGTLR